MYMWVLSVCVCVQQRGIKQEKNKKHTMIHNRVDTGIFQKYDGRSRFHAKPDAKNLDKVKHFQQKNEALNQSFVILERATV